ncbi:RING-H2 finger protein [Arachis hypogaea]|nr:RING-H2 finger protein [Arachis hypogaea]
MSMSSTSSFLNHLGLGYIALAFLVLLSTLILFSYLCCNRNRNRNPHNNINNPATTHRDGVVLPRIIFVAEGDDDEDGDEERGAVGLINSYPRFQFSRDSSNIGQNPTCSICLCEDDAGVQA